MSEPRDVQEQQEEQNAQQPEPQAAEATQEQNTAPANEDSPVDENAQRIYELETALSEAQATIKEQQDAVLRARAEMEKCPSPCRG